MAVIFADPGGEFYFGVGLGARWNSSSGSPSISNTGPVGRQAASDGKVYAFKGGSSMTKNLGSNYSHMIFGFAIFFDNPPISTTIFQSKDAANVQVDIRIDGTGHTFLTRNGTTIGSVSSVVVNAGWNVFELDVTYATGATGAAQCWLNSASVVNVTSVQTANTDAFANGFTLLFPDVNCYFKDIWVLDATTGSNTTHLGDVSVGVKYPNAAGVNQQWTPNSGTQVSRVQDGITHTGTWPDGDTTYISDGTAGDISDFAHETLTLTGTLYCVGHLSYVRKDDAGARAFRQVCLSGGTTETNGVDLSATNSFLYYEDYLDVDPNTSAQWTVANYNAATFGVKEIT